MLINANFEDDTYYQRHINCIYLMPEPA